MADPTERLGRASRSWLAAGANWRRALGSTLYLVCGAGMVLVLIPVLSPYLEPSPRLDVAAAPSVLATWEGSEEGPILSILDRFQRQNHISVSYRSAGERLPLYLADALAQNTPPDIAILPQPGELVDLARQDKLVPLGGIVRGRDLADTDVLWQRYASWRNRLYGVYFKVANKSVVWYRPDLFQKAGIQAPPATLDELLGDAARLRAIGVTPFAMCGASGWTLTDWFENLYLQTAGPNAYDALATRRVPWTDPSVALALADMAQVFSPQNAGDASVSTPYPDCVSLAFKTDSQIAMVMEGDFVQSAIQSVGRRLRAGPGGDYDFFPFPRADRNASSSAIVGGDVAVMLRDSPQARKLIQYLATADAGRVWAAQGGFISPHRSVSDAVYPDPISRDLAAPITTRGSLIRYDLSDQAPAAFGSTVGQGEWAALQRWLGGPSPDSPTRIAALQAELEQDAQRAYPAP